MNKLFKTIWIIMVMLSCQQGFAQNSLGELMQIAGENNPSLKARFDRYQAALEQIEQKEALPDPTLSFGYFISPVETRVGPQRFKLSIAQMFPWMGTNKLKANAAAASAKIQFEKFMVLRNELFYNVKLNYADLYLLRREIELKEEEINIIKSFEPSVRVKYEANLVSLTDLIRVQISIENAQSALRILQQKEVAILSQLNTNLNRPTQSEINDIALPLDEHTDFASLDTTFQENPNIKMALARVNATDQLITLNERSNRPNIGVGLDYTFVGQRNDMNVPDNGKDIIMPMFSISLPIFGKKNQAKIQEAKYLKTSAEQELIAEQNKLRNSWEQMRFAQERLRLMDEQFREEIKQTELILEVLISEYTNRNSKFEELLSTQKRLNELKLALKKIEIDRYKAIIGKEFLSGNTLKEIEYEIK